MKREIHLRELQLLDAVRRRFMRHQQTLKETELQRLDDEIERKVSKRASVVIFAHYSFCSFQLQKKKKTALLRLCKENDLQSV